MLATILGSNSGESMEEAQLLENTQQRRDSFYAAAMSLLGGLAIFGVIHIILCLVFQDSHHEVMMMGIIQGSMFVILCLGVVGITQCCDISLKSIASAISLILFAVVTIVSIMIAQIVALHRHPDHSKLWITNVVFLIIDICLSAATLLFISIKR